MVQPVYAWKLVRSSSVHDLSAQLRKQLVTTHNCVLPTALPCTALLYFRISDNLQAHWKLVVLVVSSCTGIELELLNT